MKKLLSMIVIGSMMSTAFAATGERETKSCTDGDQSARVVESTAQSGEQTQQSTRPAAEGQSK